MLLCELQLHQCLHALPVACWYQFRNDSPATGRTLWNILAQASDPLALQAAQASTDGQPSPPAGGECAASAAYQPIRSPFAGPLVGQHSHPLGAKAGIHAPRLQNPDPPGQHLPSPHPARTPPGQPGGQPGGLMQWHMSGVSSFAPSEGPPTSPSSLAPAGGSDVSSLTSFHGVPPWPQSSTPAAPSDDPLPSRHSSGWVQMPWGEGNSAGNADGLGHGPAGASRPGSQGGFMEGASNPSCSDWVPESQTLQEARRLMSGEIQPEPSGAEDTGGSCMLELANPFSQTQSGRPLSCTDFGRTQCFSCLTDLELRSC